MKHNAKPCSNARRVTCVTEQPLLTVKGKVKVKSLYLTSVVPSVTRLVSMEADGAPFTPLPLSVLRFTGIKSYGYTDQKKVERNVWVTEDGTRDLSLRKPRTRQLSHDSLLLVI